MKISKLGHCCLLIEEKGLKILTDPGNYSTLQNDVKDIDVILITHEHADHLHIESLKKVLGNNPKAEIITNASVGKILEKENISFNLLEDRQNLSLQDVLFEGFGNEHQEIYESFGMVQNTGYFIGQRLFYPGDAFYVPPKKAEILALPVAGPWCRIKDSIKYALEVSPKVTFPVHDGALKIFGGSHKVPEEILSKNSIKFEVLNEGDKVDL